MAADGKIYELDDPAKTESETLKRWAEARDESEWSNDGQGKFLYRDDLPSGVENLLRELDLAVGECGTVSLPLRLSILLNSIGNNSNIM
jgi:hypothetical protein